jgi:hypothetical protein
MADKKYRRWGSMKNAKAMKIQVEETTLLYLEHRSYVGRQTQVSYGKAIDDLCRDFQGLLKEHQRLLGHYKNLIDRVTESGIGSSGDRVIHGQPGQVG